MTMTSQPGERALEGQADDARRTSDSPTAPWDATLAVRQLQAIEAFTRGRRVAEQAAAASARSREMRMDSARRMAVLRRQHQAVVARAHEQLQAAGGPLAPALSPRVVLAHGNEWFLGRVSAALAERGLEVVAHSANGADVIGLAVCEQPDLVLVEDALPMVPGEDVVRQLREVCPGARIVAQCGYGDRVGPLLEAGAAGVYTRQVPPVDVAAAMCRLVS